MEEGEASSDLTIGAHFSANTRCRVSRARVQETPPISGPVRQLAKLDASLFNDELSNQRAVCTARRAVQPEIGNYFVSKCLAVRTILN